MSVRAALFGDIIGAMASFTATRRPGPLVGKVPEREQNKGGAGIVLLAGAGLLAYLWVKDHGGGAGAACGSCSATQPNVPDGLWVECADPSNPNTCTIWAVKTVNGQKVRYGITTPAQLLRCYGPNPVIRQLNGQPYSFGNGDTTSFIGTVGDISAGCACPDVPH